MHILVFIKQVADTEARIIIKGDQKSLEIENKYNINFFDEVAIEEAIRIKERIKDSQVTVCTYGTKKAVEALRTAIAMGADRAFLLDNTNLENHDPLIIAKILSSFAKREGFDLILCGRQAIDDENANIGAITAEFLGIPHVSAILKLEIMDEKKVRVESELEGGREVVEVQLPALLTTQKGLNEPRVPLITGVMKAMKAAIPSIDPCSLGIAKEDINTDASRVIVLSYEPPKKRPPVKIIEGETPEEKVENLMKVLKEEAKAI
ncbi:MAG: electron transfer flavoprotein subunit beta/FixA family protein [Proteobacteria bacterium]|nr:electron transfer flavoprotein subunit beta/FixA family protein [Pseudomonadota bacterium]